MSSRVTVNTNPQRHSAAEVQGHCKHKATKSIESHKLEDKQLRCYFSLKFVAKIRKPACNENHSNKGRSRRHSKQSRVLTHTLQWGKWRHDLWPESTERRRFAHVPKCDSDEHELEWELLRTRTRTRTPTRTGTGANSNSNTNRNGSFRRTNNLSDEEEMEKEFWLLNAWRENGFSGF